MTLEEAAGHRLGRSVTDYRGNVLLQSGVELTPRFIEALRQRGFRSVPVFDPLASDVESDDAIREETRQSAVRVLEELAARSAAQGDMAPLMPAVQQILDQILADIASNPDLAINLGSLRSVDDVLFTHSVNVCVFALILGRSLALDVHDMRRLGTGALLHDIGKVHFLDLARKPGDLTPEEREIMERHTTEGFRMLRDQKGVHLLSATIALQHHERLDGSGYPRGLRGKDIHAWAQVAAVVDVYDTITADRPYRDAKPPHEAMVELVAMAEAGKLDARLVRQLMWRMAAYPEGTILLLRSGEVAVVAGQSHLGGQCPRVRVLSDAGLHLVTPEERVLDGSGEGRAVRNVLAEYPPVMLQQMQVLSGS